jgi:hypothetical protein
MAMLSVVLVSLYSAIAESPHEPHVDAAGEVQAQSPHLVTLLEHAVDHALAVRERQTKTDAAEQLLATGL